jgi:hypothetical protein
MGRRACSAYGGAVGTYVGAASLRDANYVNLADVRVTLARADADGEAWYGSVQGLGDEQLVIDGQDVIVELPAGFRGRARVVIDLTGDVALVRLVGTGPAPI